MHRSHPALRTGSLKLLGGDHQYLAYGRFSREEQFVILINNDDRPRRIRQSVWAAGLQQNCEMNRLLITSDEGYSFAPIRYQVREGKLEILMPAHGAAVFIAVHR